VGENDLGPSLVDALVGKKVIGAAAGGNHIATDNGELFTFGLEQTQREAGTRKNKDRYKREKLSLEVFL